MRLEQNIALAVKSLSNQFHRYMTARKRELTSDIDGVDQITDLQGRIINYLYLGQRNGVAYQRDLERHFNIRRSTATNILKRLERHGFISRVTSDRDARMKIITLTSKAKKLYPRARTEILKAERQAAKGLTDAELALFFRIVEIMEKNMS